MAQPDLAGMLTGITQAPIDPMAGQSMAQRQLSFGAQAGQGLRQGLGGLFGADTRTTKEKADQMLAQLDVTKKADRDQMLQIVSNVNPQAAPALRARFAQMEKEQGLLATQTSSDKSRREAVAKQLSDTHPDLAKSIIAEQGSGGTESLKAGLLILTQAAKPSTAQGKKIVNLVNTKTDRTIGTAVEVDGQLYLQNPDGTVSTTPMSPAELQDKGVSTSYVKRPAPLVTTVEDSASKAAAERRNKLFEPLNTVAEATEENAIKAVDKKQGAVRILEQVERDANTGTIQGMTSNLYKFAQSAYQAMGMPLPSDITNKTTSKAFYQKLSAEGLLPRIAEQGKGFTDPEREFFLNEVLPSYNQTFQFNELSGTMQLVEAQMDIEENGFAQARRAYYVNEDVTPSDTHAEAFSNYLERLPMAKFEKHTRKVGGKDVTYDRMVALQDNAKLYQYWTDGQAPRGFTLPIKNQKTNTVEETDLNWGQINALAKKNNTTPRQLLAQAQRTGNIIKAVY
jgi:hypothetical protein